MYAYFINCRFFYQPGSIRRQQAVCGHYEDLVSPPLLEGLCCSKKAVNIIYNVILSNKGDTEPLELSTFSHRSTRWPFTFSRYNTQMLSEAHHQSLVTNATKTVLAVCNFNILNMIYPKVQHFTHHDDSYSSAYISNNCDGWFFLGNQHWLTAMF